MTPVLRHRGAQEMRRSRHGNSRHGNWRLREAIAGETGAAVVETTLVTVLLAALVLGVLQVGIALYVRTVLISAAEEGARAAARSPSATAAGVAKVRSVVTDTFGTGYHVRSTITQERRDGADTIAVRIEAPLPLLGIWGLSDRLSVTGHALVEQ